MHLINILALSRALPPALAIVFAASLALSASAGTPDDDFLMDEIIVTATKRASSIQDIPISVQGIGAEVLQGRGTVDLRGIVHLSPSVSLITAQSVANTASIRIRGIGTTGNNAGFESSVGIFVDGVYQPRPGIAFGEFADIDQVEVLRGPQGTLFGRNTSVGAISVKSKRPDIFESDGYASLSVGNYGMVNVSGGFNQPLADSMAFRIGGSYRNRQGTATNANPALPDSNNMDRYLVRAQYLWEPSDAFSLRVIADASESDERCCDPVLVALNTTTAGPGQPQPPGTSVGPGTAREDRITESLGRDERSDQYGISAELVWSINDAVELTYLPAYRDSEAVSSGDDDFTAVDVVHTDASNPNRGNIESQTHELRVQGEAFAGLMDWLFGLYYGDEDIDELSVRVAGSAVLFPAPATTANLFEQRGESYSIFAHNIMALSDALTLTLGLRYVDERKKGGLVSSVGENANCAGEPGNDDFTICNPIWTPAAISALYDLYPDAEFEDDALTYTASLAASLSDDALVYIGVSEGFKSGGLNLDITGTGSASPTFESEVARSYEIGAKTRLLGGRVTANLALFHMDIDDFQLLTFSGVGFNVFNIEAAKSTGAELDIDAQLHENLLLKASFAYTDARFPSDCTSSVDPAISRQCGNDMPNAPEIVAVVGADWRLPLSANMNLVLTPNARFESSSQPSPLVPSFKQKSNTVIDLRASFQSTDERFAVELWGKNVTDQDNMTRAFDSVSNLLVNPPAPAAPTTFGAQHSWLIDPRTYGVTFRSKF